MTDTIKKEIERFGKICCKTQEELKCYLNRFLISNGYKVISEDGFLYAKGEQPILVTAHMDTVHKTQCKRYNVFNYKGKHRIQSRVGIGGDDRCGIYMIVRMILDGYRPSVLFCEDEEIGSVGATKFTYTKYIKELKEMKYLIELDRANANDVVFYDCDNKEFKDFIINNTQYEEASGTWTDIVELSDACGIASVNFSCGYYNAHTTSEYVIFEEMINTLMVVEELLSVKCDQFDYQKKKVDKWIFADDDDYYRSSDIRWWNSYKNTEMSGMEISWNDPETGKEASDFIQGTSEVECMYMFFIVYSNVCYNDIIDYYYV